MSCFHVKWMWKVMGCESVYVRAWRLAVKLMELSRFRTKEKSKKKAEKGNKNTQLKDKLIIVCHGKSNIKAASSSLTTNVQSEWILCTVWRIVRIYFYLPFVLWRLFPFYCVMASAWSTLSTSVCLHVFILLRWMDEPCALTSPSIVQTIFSFTLWSLCFLRNSFWSTAV